MKTTKNILKDALVTTLVAAGIVWFVNGLTKESRVHEPYTLVDVTNDGVEDAVTIFPDYQSDHFDKLGLADGQYLRKDLDGKAYRDSEGFVYARGGAMPLLGTPVKRPESYVDSRVISVGNYNENPMLDVKISDSTPDFPVSVDQYLYDVFPAPTKIMVEKEVK